MVDNRTVVSMRYAMKNSKGEVLTSLDDCPAFTFLPGSGVILPALESKLHGMKKGEEKAVVVSPQQGIEGLGEEFHFDILIDDIRPATEDEIRSGLAAAVPTAEDCGPACSCRCETPLT